MPFMYWVVYILVILLALVAVVTVMYVILSEKRHDDSSKYVRSPYRDVPATHAEGEHGSADAETAQEAGTPTAHAPLTDDKPAE